MNSHVYEVLRRVDRSFQFRDVGSLTLYFDRPVYYVFQKRERFVKKLDRIKQPVRQTHIEGLCAIQHAVLIQGIINDQFESLIRADETRSQSASSPAGNQSKETFREGNGRDCL